MRLLSIFSIVPLTVTVFAMAACQGRLIYPGQRYAQVMWDKLPPDLVPLRYTTGQGPQVSFYQPPKSGGEPRRLWLVCNGNGGYALQWPDVLPTAPDREAGYLLFEYPGYGFSEGSSTPGRILAASEAAVEALRGHLGLARADLYARLSVLGHSLGCAAGLQYAAHHPVQRIVLAAPFTSMVEMGNHILFWPCGQLSWHRFDNVARLAEIAGQQPRPQIDIVHGTDDEMIPPGMSERLAAPYAGWVRLTPIPGGDHGTVVMDAVQLLGAAARP
jgi:pimeloyl-ACP methyl ester carboxylesterase